MTIPIVFALEKNLNDSQKRVLDEAWDYFLANGTPFPTRNLPKVIGKQNFKPIFKGLNGLIYETTEGDIQGLLLTRLGAFLTGHKDYLLTLYLRLFNLSKTLYEENSLISQVKKEEIKDRLQISDDDCKFLFYLLRLYTKSSMPFHLSGWSNNGSDWAITITDEVMSLYGSDDSQFYLAEKLSQGYSPDDGCFIHDRLHDNFYQTLIKPFNQNPLESFNQKLSYIDLDRIEQVRNINSGSFDCTRLACLLTELNDCASRDNVHAVIMLTRAILDHVPPAFGYEAFKQVASNYTGGGSSFKKSMERLESQARRVADRLLHMPIREKEVAPSMGEVHFQSELETLLSEFCRILKSK